jgi:hypothetical protein
MTTRELCRRLEITERQIQWWCEQGATQCDHIQGHGGQGLIRDFNEDEALGAGIMAELRRRGVPFNRLRKLRIRNPQRDYLVTDADTTVCIWCTENELLACCEASPCGFYVVSLGDVRKRLYGPLPPRRRGRKPRKGRR